jgi:hypothetical protein
MKAHLERRYLEILRRFQRRMAVSRLGGAIQRWIIKSRHGIENKVRYTLKFIVGAKIGAGFAE